jgi:SAM-dependent methyltransferase
MVARLNPETNFIGVDLSPEMLEKARKYAAEQSLENLEFLTQDISDLRALGNQSVDAVVSTVALHHLPDVAALDRTFSEVNRILKPGGGIYLVDFGHLKSEKSINYFAYQYADRQPELFTLDYLYSLQAAFQREEFKILADRHLQGRASLYSTFLSPFMVAVKSPGRATPDPGRLRKLRDIQASLPPHHQKDLADLRSFFRLGGLRSTLLG